MKRKSTGELGERLAADFLRKRGYRILETNFRCRAGEIDIIARSGDTLVFVEVRTKTNLDFGSPEESLSPGKRQHLTAAVETYLQGQSPLPAAWRVDLVAIELDGDSRARRIDLIENAIDD